MQVLKVRQGVEMVVIYPRPIAGVVAKIVGKRILQPFVFQRRAAR